jgi:hypothetical protein
MTDERHDLGEQRQLGPDHRVALDDALPGGGADRDLVAFGAHEGQFGNARDVDQELRPRQPHRHQRHQGLATGDDPRLPVGREQRAGLVEVRRPRVGKGSGLHRGPTFRLVILCPDECGFELAPPHLISLAVPSSGRSSYGLQ